MKLFARMKLPELEIIFPGNGNTNAYAHYFCLHALSECLCYRNVSGRHCHSFCICVLTLFVLFSFQRVAILPWPPPSRMSKLANITVSDDVIARGRFSTIFRAERNACPVAAKKFDLQNVSIDPVEFYRELRGHLDRVGFLCHPNLVVYHGAVHAMQPKHMYVVTELMEFSLRHRVCRLPPLTLRDTVDVSLDVLHAIRYLHEGKPPMVHSRLTGHNVLIAFDSTAKIADWHLAGSPCVHQVYASKLRQGDVVAYLPQEVLVKGHVPTSKADIFALGVIMTEASLSRPAASGLSLDQQTAARCRVADITALEERFGACGFATVVKSCLEVQTPLRPTAMQLESDVDVLRLSTEYMWCERRVIMEDDGPAPVSHNILSRKLSRTLKASALDPLSLEAMSVSSSQQNDVTGLEDLARELLIGTADQSTTATSSLGGLSATATSTHGGLPKEDQSTPAHSASPWSGMTGSESPRYAKDHKVQQTMAAGLAEVKTEKYGHNLFEALDTCPLENEQRYVPLVAERAAPVRPVATTGRSPFSGSQTLPHQRTQFNSHYQIPPRCPGTLAHPGNGLSRNGRLGNGNPDEGRSAGIFPPAQPSSGQPSTHYQRPRQPPPLPGEDRSASHHQPATYHRCQTMPTSTAKPLNVATHQVPSTAEREPQVQGVSRGRSRGKQGSLCAHFSYCNTCCCQHIP